MKGLRTLLFIASLLCSFSGYASSRAVPGDAGADPGRCSETPTRFTLPVGLPFTISSSRDSNNSNGKDTIAKKIIKGQTPSRKKVYQLNIGEDDATTWRQTDEAFRQAQDMNADFILVRVEEDHAYNTVNKIKSHLFHYKTPVLLCVENKNTSVNSIIPLNKDTLSHISSLLHAARHSADPQKENEKENERAVTTYMLEKNSTLDPGTFIPVKNQNSTSSVNEVLAQAGISNYDLIDYKPTAMGKLIDLLVDPAITLLLAILMVMGIYFQLRSIGSGLPLFAAVSAGLLFFAGHAFEGQARSWEIALFITGLLLVALDVYLFHQKPWLSALGIPVMAASLSLCVCDDELLLNGPDLYTVLELNAAVLLGILFSVRIERMMLGRLLRSSYEEKALPVPPPGLFKGAVSS